MIHRPKADLEKPLLGLATLAFAASVIWLGQQQGAVRRLRAQPVAAVPAGASYEPAGLKPPETRVMAWPSPAVQSHGPRWHYELFTPPVIYYNAPARSFTVTPPLPDQGGSEAPPGLELLAVRPEEFRLQLVGYFGAPGDYRAAFISPGRPGTLLAREGRRWADLGLSFKRFAVEKIPVAHAEAWPVYDVAARAVLADEQTGAEVVLDSRARKFTETVLAVLQTATGGPPREVREGDTFAEGDSTYHVERIQLEPPEVVVTRTTPGLPQPEKRVLHPAGRTGGLTARPFPTRPARELAASGN